MDDGFDPYWEWLRIPTDRRPPSHYDLLELPEFEANPDLIRQAATRRTAAVLRYRLGDRAKDSQRLQQEISRALNCLGDPQQKQRYDARLQERAVADADCEPPPIASYPPWVRAAPAPAGTPIRQNELRDAPPVQAELPHARDPDNLLPLLDDVPPMPDYLPPLLEGPPPVQERRPTVSEGPPMPDDIPPVQSPAAGRLYDALARDGDRAARTKVRRVRWSSLRSWQRMAVAGGAVAAVIVALGLLLLGLAPRRGSDAGQRDLKAKRAAAQEKVRRDTGAGSGTF